MIRILFFVALVMALFSLRANLRVRRTHAHTGKAVPSYLNVSLLSLGTVILIALANLLGLTTGVGIAGLAASVMLVCLALLYSLMNRK